METQIQDRDRVAGARYALTVGVATIGAFVATVILLLGREFRWSGLFGLQLLLVGGAAVLDVGRYLLVVQDRPGVRARIRLTWASFAVAFCVLWALGVWGASASYYEVSGADGHLLAGLLVAVILSPLALAVGVGFRLVAARKTQPSGA